MRFDVRTAGVSLEVRSEVDWVDELLTEALAGEQNQPTADEPDLVIRIERDPGGFPTAGLDVVSRDASGGDGLLTLNSVASSGFDLRLDTRRRPVECHFRWRPAPRERLLHSVARSRFHLLGRAALLQYPALWWAGVLGRVPVHVSGLVLDGRGVLLAGPGGLGKSTLVEHAVEHGSRAVCDNVGVTDGTRVWGLTEPLRVATGRTAASGGRRMPHGRRERPFADRLASFTPHRVLVPERPRQADADRSGIPPRLVPLAAEDARRSLTAGTYAAGELRRYWSFAAVLALGTGLGPVHPDIGAAAGRLAERLPCARLVLGDPSLGLDAAVDLALDSA